MKHLPYLILLASNVSCSNPLIEVAPELPTVDQEVYVETFDEGYVPIILADQRFVDADGIDWVDKQFIISRVMTEYC